MTEREEFEAHMKMLGFIDMHYTKSTGKFPVEGYKNQYVHYAWQAWQAARASQWVSVDERLPENDSIVVAAHLYDYGTEPDAAVCSFYQGGFYAYTDGLIADNYDGGAEIRIDMDITHWMPLPEAPK